MLVTLGALACRSAEPPPAAPTGAARSGAQAPTNAAAGAAGASGESDAPLPAAVDGTRTRVLNARMDLAVESVPAALEQVRGVARELQGFVSDSALSGTGADQVAELTLRVPADRFDDCEARLRKLAVEVRSVTESAKDVTDQVTDIDATLRNLRVVEAQYQQLLARTGSVNEVLQVQQRLDQVRLQIDRTEARQRLLASQVQMATLTVTLRAPVAGEGGRLATIRTAWADSLQSLRGFVGGLLIAVISLWWVLVIAGVAAWLFRRWRSGRRRSAAGASEATRPPDAAAPEHPPGNGAGS